jgi:hypothetical protein
MGWGTDFTTDIFLSRENYRSIYDLEDKIKEDEKDLENIRSKILMFASSNPKDIIPEDWKEEPINFIHREVNNLLDELYELDMFLNRRYLYLQYLKDSGIEYIKSEKDEIPI